MNDTDTDDAFSDTLYLSREGYERLLRRLVLSSSPRIKWMTGTVTNVNTAVGDPTIISSVDVRSPSGLEQTIPAELVVGKFSKRYRATETRLTPVLDCSGTTQAGFKWLKRISAGLDKANSTTLTRSIESLRRVYATVQQTRTYKFHIPPEARSHLTIPGGYENATWIYTVLPKFGKGKKSIYVDRIEGHQGQSWLDASRTPYYILTPSI